jgi:S1-C subfamily serine protease
MNLNDIGTQLLYTTFPILVENEDNTKGSATSFIYTTPVSGKPEINVPFLVTNYHVVENAKRCFIRLVRSKDGKPSAETITVEIPKDQLLKTVDRQNDLAVLLIGPTINQLQQTANPIFFRSINSGLIPNQDVIGTLGAIEEVTFVGCPSGIFDTANSTPLIRRGITASPIWNDFDGQPIFVIDAGVFPGSSGSPVFIYNQGSYATDKGVTIGTRVFFVGIISSAFIGGEQNKAFLGLGRVIKSHVLKQFTDSVVSTLAI